MTSADSVTGDERLRLFCGLRLPDDVLDRIGAWQSEHLHDGRIVPREHLHVTLAFLGGRPAAELSAIAVALETAARDAEEIVFTARRYRETRSVGMVVLDDSTGEGGRLAGRLFDGLEALGVYERERRAWLPHVTVLRFRSPPRLAPPVPDLGAFSPSDAAVYHSRLRPSGAQYAVLETAVLGG
ncbi:MAG TPA: 2'-5' RNA ligase family protein [Gaiellaceae bacterium]|nr:2'-5' RNA ligase family protein [Gaiellaceae bacterium]